MTRINGVEVGFTGNNEAEPVVNTLPDPIAIESHRIECERAEKLIEEDRLKHESGDVDLSEILGNNSGARKFGEVTESDVLGYNRGG